jgi:branched-chain amino acid transport system permease protein
MILLEILVYGAVQSSVYALLAVGFALVFGVARVVNLFHGSFYTLGAYVTYSLGVEAGFPMVLSILCGMAAAFLLGAALDRYVVARVRDSMIKVLIVTLALTLFFEQCIYHVFGPEHLNIPPLVSQRVTLLGVDIGGQRLLVLAVSVTVIAVLWFAVNRTRAGNALLATAQNPEAAELMKINTRRIFMVTTGLAGCMAALAGGIVSSFIMVYPKMGILPMIKAFTIVILGGLGSLGGSILAAVIIGYLETIVAFLISADITDLVPLVAIFLTLVLRPNGLFGKRFKV